MRTTQVEEIPVTDTMLYRAAGPDSRDVQDIWGRKLETVVVEAAEVGERLSDGWVRSPLEIAEDGKPAPKVQKVQSDVAALTAAADELEAANKRVAELTEELAQMRTRAEAAEAEAEEARELIAAVDGDGDGKPGGSRKKKEG